MKTAERKRSSSGPSTSHKKRKSEWSESFARDLEAVEKEDVVAEEAWDGRRSSAGRSGAGEGEGEDEGEGRRSPRLVRGRT